MFLKHLLQESHSVPLFNGKRSRRHKDVPLWRLALNGMVGAAQNYSRFRGVDAFVQFIGFPRSGHSLIGSILDAHPQAIISHELDAMGLIKKGFSEEVIYGLIRRNSAEFSRNGRYWNGFSYAVPGQPNGKANELTIIGDKKGDWAVRWCKKEPRLIKKVYGRIRAGCKWILVTRNPLDNIATMSLRKNKTYDKLRIASSDPDEFKTSLRAHQEQEEISPVARDDMIDDYEGLCESINEMKTTIPDGDQLYLQYERFCNDPKEEIRRLCHFLGVPATEDYVSSCASIVKSSSHKSRNKVKWTEGQLERVERLSRHYPFLQNYVDSLSVNG